MAPSRKNGAAFGAIQKKGAAFGRAVGARARAAPANYLKTHPSPPYRSLRGLLYCGGGLKSDLTYIQLPAELVWDLTRGLIDVNFNEGIVNKLDKSKS